MKITLVRHSRSLLSGNPESFLKELDSGWSLSSQVVSGEPAGMTALTTIFGSMTAYEALLMNSLVIHSFFELTEKSTTSDVNFNNATNRSVF